MEGVGSRPSRTSSRYSLSPAAPVFNGPVRKWKKQWVSSLPKNTSGGSRNDARPLLLCRWTPLSAADDEPRKRRFRYTPTVPIEKGNTETLENARNEVNIRNKNQSKDGGNIRTASDTSNGDISAEETQELSEEYSESNKSMDRSFAPKTMARTAAPVGGRISFGESKGG